MKNIKETLDLFFVRKKHHFLGILIFSCLTFTANGMIPTISFNTSTLNTNETATITGASCQNYHDVTITMAISEAAAGDAVVTVAYGGTATGNGIDYTEGTAPEITFPSGSTADQTFVIRIWDDEEVESNETIVLTYSISGSTNGTAGISNQTLTITITDDDLTPNTAGINFLLNEDFSGGIPGGWIQTFFACPCTTPVNEVWKVGTAGYSGNSLYISDDGGVTRGDDLNKIRRLAMVTSSINATAVSTDITLQMDLDIGGDASNDHFEIFYNINSGGWFPWQLIHSHSGIYTITAPAAFQGTNFQLGFIWRSNGDGSMIGNVPAIDNIKIFVDNQVAKVENGLTTLETPLGPNQTVNIYNGEKNNIVAQVTNLSSWDYGCTTFAIDRTGTGATQFLNPNAASYATQKTLLITPTNNKVDGDIRVRLYYSAAEIAGWEAATGENRTDLTIFKSPNAISSSNGNGGFGTNISRGAYNTNDYYVQGDFNTGFSGFASASVTQPLPVELINFEAVLVGNQTKLSWQTITEINNSHFEVAFSLDGINFETIGTVNGAGTTIDLELYEFFHDLKEYQYYGGSLLYYRLKQVDFDGTFEYTDILNVEYPLDGYQHQNKKLNIFPNPASTYFNIESYDFINEMIQIYNVYGQMVIETKHQSPITNIPVSKLPKGTYFVKIREEIKKITVAK